jgi:hypothetical protein
MADEFRWRMDASAHDTVLRALRAQIMSAHQLQQPLPMAEIIALVPLITSQHDDVGRRGAVTFTGDRFANRANDPLWITFSDPAIGEFYVTLPAVFSGTVRVNLQEIAIALDSPIELEIPKLAELGVNRGSFQDLTTITLSPEISISTLIDKTAPQRITKIEAELASGILLRGAAGEAGDAQKRRPGGPSAFEREVAARLLGAKDPCGPDPNDPVWRVYRRADGICIIEGDGWAEGGGVWVPVFGPDTKAACDRYFNANC